MPKFNTRMITALGVLLALEIVLSRFLSIAAWNMKIGFSFVPIVLAASLFGPVAGATVAGLGDFLGAILFPIGPYFPGFTLTAALGGAVFGLFLDRKKRSGAWWQTALAVLIHQGVLSLLLNTLWISILYTSPYVPLLVTRIAQSALMAAVQFVVIRILLRMPERLGGKQFT